MTPTLPRGAMLEYLLRPITLPRQGRTDVQSMYLKRKAVSTRHSYVDAAYPFMSDEEKARADAWRIAEAHDELWAPVW